ncbi:MAG TPA: hypothetical protein GXZ79_02170 [Acholeplasma sp.]|jgi:hypothetical protein|nr:hypothetical protein [Acholeplasma sp.]
MAWNDETYLIGERVRVENEKNPGVVTRIDKERGLIYVLYKRMREEAYPYPEVIDQKIMIPLVQKKG